jgi:flagellar basal-body rod protein FlgC
MALSDLFNISASGMSAQAQRLNVVASNMANAESAGGSDADVYRAKQVVFEATPMGSNGSAGTGVKVTQVVQDNNPGRRVFDPQHPLADADGYVTMPNVNPVDEMVNMISASRSYQNNVDIMNTAKQLMTKILTLGT